MDSIAGTRNFHHFVPAHVLSGEVASHGTLTAGATRMLVPSELNKIFRAPRQGTYGCLPPHRAEEYRHGAPLVHRHGSLVPPPHLKIHNGRGPGGHTTRIGQIATGAPMNAPTQSTRMASRQHPQIVYQPPRMLSQDSTVKHRHRVSMSDDKPGGTGYANGRQGAVPRTVSNGKEDSMGGINRRNKMTVAVPDQSMTKFNSMTNERIGNLSQRITTGPQQGSWANHIAYPQTCATPLHQVSPTYHHSSFSRVTGAPSTRYHAGSPLPVSTPSHPTAFMLHLKKASTQLRMHKHQQFDFGSHADEVSMAPKTQNTTLAPTVHVPNAPVINEVTPYAGAQTIADVSQCSGSKLTKASSLPPILHSITVDTFSALLANVPSMESEVPLGDGKNDAASSRPSPLHLLSLVSTSPTALSGVSPRGANYAADESSVKVNSQQIQDNVNQSHPDAAASEHEVCGYQHGSSYPPMPQAYDEKHPEDAKIHDANVSPSPKSMLPMELILSAASTLECLDTKKEVKVANNKRKRNVSEYSHYCETIRSTSTGAGSPSHFSVGEYPTDIDPSSLTPTRASRKRPKPSNGRIVDPNTVTQAQQASQLARQALERPRVGKQLLLSMALVRTSPRNPPSAYPAHGTVLTDRFHWSAFPPLDNLLRKNMKEYYELSMTKCQSLHQQAFNEELVYQIKEEAQKYGWKFDDKVFDNKMIRHRVRCFFKIHIQNAKKRLNTMLRNPEKAANIKALAAHFHLIEETGVDYNEETEQLDETYSY